MNEVRHCVLLIDDERRADRYRARRRSLTLMSFFMEAEPLCAGRRKLTGFNVHVLHVGVQRAAAGSWAKLTGRLIHRAKQGPKLRGNFGPN